MKQRSVAAKLILIVILAIVVIAGLSAIAVAGFFILWLLYPSPVAH